MINNLIGFGEQITEILTLLIAIGLVFAFSLIINKPRKSRRKYSNKYSKGDRFKSI